MKFLEINPEDVRDATVLLDVDGTLLLDSQTEAHENTLAHVRLLAAIADVHLVSNGNAARTKALADILDIHALPKLRKPFSHPAVKSLRRKERTVVIGDKFLTDGLFAHRIGAEFTKVERLTGAHDSFSAKASFILDDTVWSIMPYLALMRPRHWIKNLLVFMPLFFAGGILVPGQLQGALAAFVVFSIAASSVYVLNDIFDRKQDALHPKKKYRPIASGVISIQRAYLLMVFLAGLLALTLWLYPVLILPTILYVSLNGAYTAWFKHLAVVDVLCVASFYLIRLVAGGMATNVPLSSWIILCTFFGALFLIVGKRRAEFRHSEKRRVLESYSRDALDFMLAASAGLTVISYGLYSILAHDLPHLVYSTAFILLAVFRMLNRIYTHPELAESPETFFYKDPVVFLSLLSFALYTFVVFYLG